MSNDVSIEDPFLIIVRIPPGRLPAWKVRGWVCVETYSDERDARDRFHVLKPVLEELRTGAALIRGFVDHDRKVVEHTRTIMVKDAEFWTLPQAEIRVPGREDEALWHRTAVELLEAAAARDEALKPGRTPVKPPRVPVRLQAAGLAAAGAAAVFVTYASLPPPPERPSTTFAAVKRNGTTILIPDPKDSSSLIEYELHDDGTQVAIGKVARSDPRPADRGDSADGPRTRSLVEGINMFLRVRQ